MGRLFIIGNGYDMNRRGDTSYDHFKKWLEKSYLSDAPKCMPIYKDGKFLIPDGKPTPCYPASTLLKMVETESKIEQRDLKEKTRIYDLKRKYLAIAVLYATMDRLKENKWGDFENTLSEIPFKDLIKEYKATEYYTNDSPLGSPVDQTTDLFTSLNSEIQSLFSEWIISLENKNTARKGFEDVFISDITPEDTFIIFNYTRTIEKLFNYSNSEVFYHIHGTYEDKNTIIVGHNSKERSASTHLDSEDDYINNCYACLYKNPEKVIENNQELWDRILNYRPVSIYEFGWGCANVDMDYVDKIVKLVRLYKDDNYKMINLYLNDFEGGGQRKKEQWEKCGFPSESIHLYNETEDGIEINDG